MPDTLVNAAAPVLDYGLRPSSHNTAMWGRLVLILTLAATGAFGGYFIRPAAYSTTGYLKVEAAPTSGVMNLLELQTQQSIHTQAIQSSVNIATAVSAAKRSGVTLTTSDIAKHLNVRAVPASKLILVSYTGSDPTIATTVVTALMTNYIAAVSSAQIASMPAVPSPPPPQPMFIFAGLAVGLAVGSVIDSRRRR